MIYESRGSHAGKPRAVLPMSYKMQRPVTGLELSRRLRKLAHVFEQNGAYRPVRGTGIGSVIRDGNDGIAALLGLDLAKLMKHNSDLFLIPPSSMDTMLFIEFADSLRLAATKLEGMR